MTQSIPLPPHAYLPGLTPRHAPAFFAELHASVRAGAGRDELAGSLAWRAGLLYLEQGYGWEAHEALEPVWMQTPPASPERALVQGIIQIANAVLKARMGRPRAVSRLCDIAEAHLDRAFASGAETVMGQYRAPLTARIAMLRRESSSQ